MIYTDRVYGRQIISEPVMLELIKSPALQRLKGVMQSGYGPLYFWFHRLTNIQQPTRFEHSLGVFFLLKRFNASLKEQIAGLIHDVSHTVFSHTADYVFSAGSVTKHNYQDKIFAAFVKKTAIPMILRKYKIDPDYILNEKNFPLKEKNLPDLCADRLDYSLRNALEYQVADQQEVDYFLNHLLAKNNAWVFKNLTSARRYANLFRRLNTVHYAGFPTAVMFQTMADLLKHGLRKKYLAKKDFFTTDQAVLAKLKKYRTEDKKLKLLFQRIAPGKIKITNNPRHYAVHTLLKSRAVDPLLQINGQTKRLSAVDQNWTQVIKQEMKPKEYFLRFEE